ncbi:MAG: glycosyltransferase family 4 protein [archaeon]
MNFKIIQISSSSHSFAMENYEQDIFRGWYAQVAYQLKKFYPKIEVECWTPERKYKKEKTRNYENIKFRIFPSTFSLRHGMDISIQMIKALKKEIIKAKIEKKKLILHIHEYHSWQAYLILFLKKNGFKIIAQHHGGRSPFKNLGKFKKLFFFLPAILIMQAIENNFLRKVEVFYALSNEEISYLKRTAPNSKIKFQTMGIDDEFFKKGDKIKARKKLGFEKNKKYVLYIGRISKNKGVLELVEAMKSLGESVNLLLIGEGSIERYKKFTEENNIKNIRFVGAVYGKEKFLYFDACDVFVLPSYTEGAPVTLMEAIAKNLKVIATNVGGVSKMMENGREGLIISPKSSKDIEKALKEVLIWKKKDIRKNSERYKWDKIIRDTFDDYN